MNQNLAINKRIGDSNLFRLLIIFVISFVTMSVLEPAIFLKKKYIVSMMFLFPEYGLLALAMMLTMISGGIDLSVVATANFAGILSVKFLIWICPAVGVNFVTVSYFVISLIIAILIGGLCGGFIGFFISRLGVPAMLATLGGADLIMGLSLILTKGSVVKNIPEIVSVFGNKVLMGFLPTTVVVFVICAGLLSLILEKTPLGVRIKMFGSNPIASKFSGINNVDIIYKTYVGSGMLSAMAGILLISRANSARADYGSSYVMQAIIIAVLGGTNPKGGFGKVGGIVVAILILQVLSSGFNMFPEISNFYRSIIWGAVLILAIVYNHLSLEHKKRLSSKQK